MPVGFDPTNRPRILSGNGVVVTPGNGVVVAPIDES